MARPAHRTLAQVVDVGARGPLGLCAAQLAACTRARKLEPRTLRQRDARGRPIGACVTGGLPPSLQGVDRLVALAAPALAEAWADHPPAPLLLALPEPGRADEDHRLDGEVLAMVADAAGVRIDATGSRVIRQGRAGFATAVEGALAAFAAGASRAVVGGVDSLLHPSVLRALDGAGRLHALDTGGVVLPSEAAAFVVLAPPGEGRALGRIEVVACEEVDEPANEEAERAAARRLVAATLPPGEAPVGWVLTDLNGETTRIRRWARHYARTAAGACHDRPLDDLGEIGAASGAVLTVMACEAWRTGRAPHRSATMVLASDGPHRAMLRLAAPGPSPANAPPGDAHRDPRVAVLQLVALRPASIGANEAAPATDLSLSAEVGSAIAGNDPGDAPPHDERVEHIEPPVDDEPPAYEHLLPPEPHELPGRHGECAQLTRIARDCLEEMGAMLEATRLGPNDPWRPGRGTFETRALRDLEALDSLAETRGSPPGPWVDPATEALRLLADALDPLAPAAAVALVLGSRSHPQTAAAVQMLVERSPASWQPALCRGLVLAPTATVDDAMQILSGDSDPGNARFAVAVLAARAQATPARLQPALDHADHDVRRAALRALAFCPLRDEAITALLQPAAAEPAGTWALAHHDAPAALALARPTLDALPGTSPLELLEVLALAGQAEDVPRLHRARTPGALRLWGWHGHASHLEPLLAIVEGTRATSARAEAAAAQALHRLTGVDASSPLPAAHRTAAVGAAVRRWRALRGPCSPTERLRHGRAWRVAAPLDELATGGRREDRRRCALELAIATGRPPVAIDGPETCLQEQLASLRAALVGG